MFEEIRARAEATLEGLTMELIDKAELMKYPIRIDHYDKEHGNEDFVLGIESVLEFAEQLPTIDMVEVVRCKDCVWKGFYKSGNGKYYPQCQNPDCGMISVVEIVDTDYCSYGRRSK